MPFRKIRGLGLIILGAIINYLTRSTLSVAAPTLLKDLQIGEQQYSWIHRHFSRGHHAAAPVRLCARRVGLENVLARSCYRRCMRISASAGPGATGCSWRRASPCTRSMSANQDVIGGRIKTDGAGHGGIRLAGDVAGERSVKASVRERLRNRFGCDIKLTIHLCLCFFQDICPDLLYNATNRKPGHSISARGCFRPFAERPRDDSISRRWSVPVYHFQTSEGSRTRH